MTTAQRVSRGFHRLGLFLAALPLLATIILMGIATSTAVEDHRHYEQLACVRNNASQDQLNDPVATINLHELGCSDDPQATIATSELYLAPLPPFDWYSALVWPLAGIVAGGLAGALMLYGLVRAIGWVVGGFVAS